MKLKYILIVFSFLSGVWVVINFPFILPKNMIDFFRFLLPVSVLIHFSNIVHFFNKSKVQMSLLRKLYIMLGVCVVPAFLSFYVFGLFIGSLFDLGGFIRLYYQDYISIISLLFYSVTGFLLVINKGNERHSK